MAKVTITLVDTPHGLLMKLDSDERLPQNTESGSIAQNLGLIGLALIKQEFEQVAGKSFQKITIQ